MWAGIGILFVLALVVISFAAGGAWLIVALPVALVVLTAMALPVLRRRTTETKSLREHRDQASGPAVQDASQAPDPRGTIAAPSKAPDPDEPLAPPSAH